MGFSTFNSGRVSYTASIFIFLLIFVAATSLINWNNFKLATTNVYRSIRSNFSLNLLPTQTLEFRIKKCNGSIPTCPTQRPAKFPPATSPAASCPQYFRWIHKDLKPWKATGITRDVLERAESKSHIRVVILKGKAYVQKHARTFQTRDLFTVWGITQLLRLYPGMIPDLELLFGCGDKTVVDKSEFGQGMPPPPPPPVFHYCGADDAFDIVFPDWTFWGWVETNIRPWETILETIQESSKKIKWEDRIPYAFWKGNPKVSATRTQLMKCNSSGQSDSNAHLYSLMWDDAVREGFKQTKLENQCDHRYKIYVEGAAWSVSEKYILACDSMTLLIKPKYYDFFTRSLVPLQHYWPISSDNMCKDIKFAVDWGNNHIDRAQEIGKEGSNYLQEKLRMKLVYDYMFHLLSQYASLLRFKPTIPKGAVEICPERLICGRRNTVKAFMEESKVKSPSNKPPCAMPPPYKPQELRDFLQRKSDLEKQVEREEINIDKQ